MGKDELGRGVEVYWQWGKEGKDPNREGFTIDTENENKQRFWQRNNKGVYGGGFGVLIWYKRERVHGGDECMDNRTDMICSLLQNLHGGNRGRGKEGGRRGVDATEDGGNPIYSGGEEGDAHAYIGSKSRGPGGSNGSGIRKKPSVDVDGIPRHDSAGEGHIITGGDIPELCQVAREIRKEMQQAAGKLEDARKAWDREFSRSQAEELADLLEEYYSGFAKGIRAAAIQPGIRSDEGVIP
eukprot:g58272.t1